MRFREKINQSINLYFLKFDVPFWNREHKISYLDPHFPELAPFWGPILTGLRKCSPKNRLTMGVLPLEHLLKGVYNDTTQLNSTDPVD